MLKMTEYEIEHSQLYLAYQRSGSPDDYARLQEFVAKTPTDPKTKER